MLTVKGKNNERKTVGGEIRRTHGTSARIKRILGSVISSTMGLALAVLPCLAADARPLRLGYLQADLHQLSAFVALEKKFYQEQGLNVQVAGMFKAGPEEMTAFAAGELDFGFVGVAPATVSVANRTARVKVVAQANNGGSALVVRSDLPVPTLKDLAGKIVAIPGHSTVQDVLLRKALRKVNVDPKDLNIMVMKPPEMLGALRTRQIAGFIAWEPFVSMSAAQGAGRVLLSSREIWPGHPCCVLAVQNEFLAKNREGVKRVLRAHVAATRFINEQRAAAAEIAIKYTGMTREVIAQAMESIDYTYEPNMAGIVDYLRTLNELRYISVGNPAGFAAAFIDGTLCKEVLSQ